jgi:hypothetical protein
VFKPSISSISRFKLQSAAHSEEQTFTVATKTTNGVDDLVFSFGDQVSHAGEFVFQNAVEGKLNHNWSWPISRVQSILNLDGDITMSISGDQAIMMISVDSGMAKYDYLLPAQTK